ncbi:hypothetical protein AKJ62_00260 [candidate division MSBL1 archaeon SCGC-AAA259D14]|uniref:Uncharacterized protein n=1 Tax=candidate division MSBL1 archaeon SCGC-AAA259D14 TaxID=1698261 RepID=A0A133U8X8_9EURY|nr:hypothetical protein AKJ62_00260 [candidate division MSBL1 archaeon SCGC-AAA259D14]
MRKVVPILGILIVLVGFWVLLGSWLSFGQITLELTNRIHYRNFWALRNFVISVMIPASIALILSGIALFIEGEKT